MIDQMTHIQTHTCACTHTYIYIMLFITRGDDHQPWNDLTKITNDLTINEYLLSHSKMDDYHQG